MSAITKPMSATSLILCLSGELAVDPALIMEAIQEERDFQELGDLTRVIRSYGAGDLPYESVLDTFGDYF